MLDNKELKDYIMEQLFDLKDVRNIPMMGGYIFYYKERIFGGIYGSGFMVKITETGRKYMPDSEAKPPYEGAKYDSRNYILRTIDLKSNTCSKKNMCKTYKKTIDNIILLCIMYNIITGNDNMTT